LALSQRSLPGIDFINGMYEVFKRDVETRTNGALNIEIIYGGALGNPIGRMSQMRNGAIQMSDASDGNYATVYPEIQVLNIPYLFATEQNAWIFAGLKIRALSPISTPLLAALKGSAVPIGFGDLYTALTTGSSMFKTTRSASSGSSGCKRCTNSFCCRGTAMPSACSESTTRFTPSYRRLRKRLWMQQR
jgi:hypothetical protein